LDQLSPHPTRAKEFVVFLLCRLPNNSEDEVQQGTLRQKHTKDGICLDKFMQHFKAKYKGELSFEGSLLDMGFTRDVGRETAQMS
jgi:hypothetical protein